jgi:sec-independent protein translocase protein TatB
VFDLSITKMVILGVLGLVIFGPDQLPRIAAQAGKALRDLRNLAAKARADISQGLGPEFADFDLADLNPKTFVRKHLLDDIEDDLREWRGSEGSDLLAEPMRSYLDGLDPFLMPGETPPYDADAT